MRRIERTLPLGTVGVERAVNEKGEREIWLEPHILRGAGESYSDVILKLAAAG
jgi:hypothetical protein